jgi:hypothetical protein
MIIGQAVSLSQLSLPGRRLISRGKLIQKILSNEELLIVLRRQIHFPRDQKALHPSAKTGLAARSHRKDARYENGKGNILLETHFKKTNRKTKDTLGE